MIRIGPAGCPVKPTTEGVKKTHELGLDALEIEFVRGIYLREDEAKKVGEIARDLNVEISVHAPYWINLASSKHRERSRQLILRSAEIGRIASAKFVVFHAAYYLKLSRSECYSIVRREIESLMDEVEGIDLAPETTGKHSQFGDLEEILRLREETGCNACIDFAHIVARRMGQISYAEILDMLEEFRKIHSHYSGIEYGRKGERKHLPVDLSDFSKLAEELLRRDKEITMIVESPETWRDAVKIRSFLEGKKSG